MRIAHGLGHEDGTPPTTTEATAVAQEGMGFDQRFDRRADRFLHAGDDGGIDPVARIIDPDHQHGVGISPGLPASDIGIAARTEQKQHRQGISLRSLRTYRNHDVEGPAFAVGQALMMTGP